MAAPFYSQADQDIYASGNKFIPQEQYRLGPYTPPEIMGQNTNAGIAAIGAADPYKWPYPEGGGEGGANISGTQVTKRPLGLSPGALGGKLPGFGNWAKRTLGNVEDIYSNLPLPSNLLRKGIRRWRENREIKKEQERIAEDRTGIGDHDRGTFEGPHPDAGSGWHPGVGGQGTGSPDGGAQAAGDLAGGSALDSPFAQGGRIGYRNGEFVEDVNVEGPGFDVNENLMASDDNNTRILENLFDKYIDLGFSPQEAEKMAMDEFELMSQGPEQDQGLASLV